MQKVLRPDDFGYYTGNKFYEFDLDEDAKEVSVTLDLRSPENEVYVGLAHKDESVLPVDAGRFVNRSFRCAGFDKLVLSCVPEAVFAVRLVVRQGRRVDRLDPTPLELIAPDRDTQDITRMIAQSVRAAIDQRFPQKFEDMDNNLDFDLDDDELGDTRYMERDTDLPDGFEERGKVRARDKPPANKDDDDEKSSGDVAGADKGSSDDRGKRSGDDGDDKS